MVSPLRHPPPNILSNRPSPACPKESPQMLPFELSLARLSDGRYYAKKAEKPVTLKTDSGVSLEIPGPRILAELYAVPWLSASTDAFRSGAAILTRSPNSRDEPVALFPGDLTNRLLDALKCLPDLSVTEAGRPYRDLRLFLTEASPTARTKYLADVVAQVRALLPAYRPPAVPKERGPAKTAAERLTAHRARVRREEELTAREWLGNFLSGWGGEEEAPAPGSRWLASELYGTAVDAIQEFADCEEERLDGGNYVTPRQRVFYAVADELIGPRRRGAKGSAMVYVIPGA